MTFDLSAEQQVMTDRLAWLIRHPDLWEGAHTVYVNEFSLDAQWFEPLPEWEDHNHPADGSCRMHNTVTTDGHTLRQTSVMHDADQCCYRCEYHPLEPSIVNHLCTGCSRAMQHAEGGDCA